MIARILFILGIFWLAGLGWFILSSPEAPDAFQKKADAIVALTGGQDRLNTALSLLADGHGPLLFISGVGAQVKLEELLDAHAPKDRLQDLLNLQDRIILGQEAQDTHGNAEETAAWLRGKPIHSIILVTSHYHMRRSLLELHHAMPGLKIYPLPVTAEATERRLDLWFIEYHKTLWAWLRNLYIPVKETR